MACSASNRMLGERGKERVAQRPLTIFGPREGGSESLEKASTDHCGFPVRPRGSLYVTYVHMF